MTVDDTSLCVAQYIQTIGGMVMWFAGSLRVRPKPVTSPGYIKPAVWIDDSVDINPLHAVACLLVSDQGLIYSSAFLQLATLDRGVLRTVA